MLKKLSEKQLMIMILAGGLLLALLGGGALYYIQSSQIDPLAAEIVDLGAKVAEAQKKVNEIPQLQAQEKKSEADMARAREMLPTLSESPLEDFYDMISAMAQQHNLEASNLTNTASAPKAGAQFQKLQWTLRVKGEFFDILTFIYRLETMKRFIKVNSFSFSGGQLSDKGGGPPRRMFNLTISLSSYTFPEEAKK